MKISLFFSETLFDKLILIFFVAAVAVIVVALRLARTGVNGFGRLIGGGGGTGTVQHRVFGYIGLMQPALAGRTVAVGLLMSVKLLV